VHVVEVGDICAGWDLVKEVENGRRLFLLATNLHEPPFSEQIEEGGVFFESLADLLELG
jgi:hypothetical protein